MLLILAGGDLSIVWMWLNVHCDCGLVVLGGGRISGIWA